MNPDLPSRAEFLLSLDTPRLIQINPQESYLKGWFVPPESVGACRLLVVVDGKKQLVYTGFPRPDVRCHLNSEAGARSGFVVRMPTPRPGQHVSLITEFDGVIRELVNGIEVEPPIVQAGAGEGKVSSYQDWIFECEPKLFQTAGEVADLLASGSYQPRISLLAEFQECHTYFLSMFLRSLAAQLYPNWQLCITGDVEDDSESFQQIRNYAARDSRVLIFPAAPNKWNALLEAADGEFITPVRVYDELHPSALWEIAASLQDKEADIIYSDEDQTDLFGQRFHPQFKPDFNNEHFLSINYIGNLTAVRRSLALKSGGFRSLPAGPREWDFLVRCVEQTQTNKILHIAKPLYHVRTQEALAESGISIPSVGPDDLCQVIRDHVTRTGKQAIAQIGFPTDTIRLQYQSPKGIRLSVFLRDEDGVFQVAALAELVGQCRVEFYGSLNGIVHRLPDPQGRLDSIFRSPIVNFEEIAGDVLLFINRPVDLLNHFFVQELVSQALRPDCGLVSGLSVDVAGHFIHTGFIGDDAGRYMDPFAGRNSRVKALGRHVRVARSVEAISDEFFAVRREYVDAVGGFAQLSSSMPQFVRTLAEYAHRNRLQVLVTPYSVGSFDCLDQQPSRSEAIRLSDQALACLNPNLSAFSDPCKLLVY